MSLMSDSLKEALGITAPEGSEQTTNPFEGDMTGLEDYMEEPKEPAKFEVQEIPTSVPDLNQTDAKVDYVVARNHTYTLLTMTSQAVARALQVAQETEHPRAFESFNSLVTTARLLTQDLLGMQKVFKEVTKERPEMTPAPATNQTQVNGDVIINQPGATTTNLLQMLNEAIAKGEIKPLVGVKQNGESN